jgi:YHS domain-containing protein
VAYFTQSKAVRGDPAISAAHAGAIYYFASDADRALFAADPVRYVPEFGGFCAFGTSQGHKATIDPEAFTIVNGKLYLNYSKDVWAKFKEDPAGYIQKADANWPEVVQQPDPVD